MRINCSRDGIHRYIYHSHLKKGGGLFIIIYYHVPGHVTVFHRPTVAGIHGGPEGAYSIALSGGYDDNIDLGEGFTYTGEGILYV